MYGSWLVFACWLQATTTRGWGRRGTWTTWRSYTRCGSPWNLVLLHTSSPASVRTVSVHVNGAPVHWSLPAAIPALHRLPPQARQEHYYFLADQWLDAKLNTLTITLEPANGERRGFHNFRGFQFGYVQDIRHNIQRSHR